jgi:hypothetical protein
MSFAKRQQDELDTIKDMFDSLLTGIQNQLDRLDRISERNDSEIEELRKKVDALTRGSRNSSGRKKQAVQKPKAQPAEQPKPQLKVEQKGRFTVVGHNASQSPPFPFTSSK